MRQPPDGGPRTSDARRVLVVDDDAKLAGILVEILERNGYETYVAESGDQALWAILERQPAAVVLDVMIPHPGGVEVCRHLRAQGWAGRIIMVSARANPADRAAAAQAGADIFLAKPFGLSELVAAVEVLLSECRG